MTLPKGSGDYAATLALVRKFNAGELTFEALAAKLASLGPHPLGCAYLTAPVPMPPPGVAFDPLLMPKDWEHTWGEVAMAYVAGALTQAQYERLHQAVHGKRPAYPNCRP